MIDEQLKHVSEVVESQTNQLKEVAGKHTAQATELTKQYMGDYTAKAQELLRGRSKSPAASRKAAPGDEVKKSDFPQAPKGFPAAPAKQEESSEEESEDEKVPLKTPIKA